MVSGGNDNNRLGFNGNCEPVVWFIQNNCIQWMDEFIQNGRHPVHRPLLFFLLFPPHSLPFPSPKASFPVVRYCCSGALHTAGLLCVAAAGYHQPPIVDARSVSIHHSKLYWTHIAETNIFVSWFSVASFPVTFVSSGGRLLACAPSRTISAAASPTFSLPFFSPSSSSSLLQFSTGLRFICQCYWYSFCSKNFASVKELLYFQVCFCRSL